MPGCDDGPLVELMPPEGGMTVLVERPEHSTPRVPWTSLEIFKFDGNADDTGSVEPLTPPPLWEAVKSPVLGAQLRSLVLLLLRPAWAFAGTTLEVKMLDKKKCCKAENDTWKW